MSRLGPFSENTIVVGDCLDIMAQMPDGCVDLVVTDPPYGVGYDEWDEMPQGWLPECQRISQEVVFTPGIANIYRYPEPIWVLGWGKPGSTRRNATGGFNHWEPLLFYGESKIWVDFVYLPDCTNHAPPDLDWHPCPKPLALYWWLVKNLSAMDGLIFDPFIGSGTTAVVADRLGRKFFGCDINPDYVEMALERLEKDRAGRQLNLL